MKLGLHSYWGLWGQGMGGILFESSLFFSIRILRLSVKVSDSSGPQRKRLQLSLKDPGVGQTSALPPTTV